MRILLTANASYVPPRGGASAFTVTLPRAANTPAASRSSIVETLTNPAATSIAGANGHGLVPPQW